MILQILAMLNIIYFIWGIYYIKNRLEWNDVTTPIMLLFGQVILVIALVVRALVQ